MDQGISERCLSTLCFSRSLDAGQQHVALDLFSTDKSNPLRFTSGHRYTLEFNKEVMWANRKSMTGATSLQILICIVRGWERNRRDNNSSQRTVCVGVVVRVSITGPSILTDALELMMMTLITKPRKPWLLIIVRTKHADMGKEARFWSTRGKVPFIHANCARWSFVGLICFVFISLSRIHKGNTSSPATPPAEVLL